MTYTRISRDFLRRVPKVFILLVRFVDSIKTTFLLFDQTCRIKKSSEYLFLGLTRTILLNYACIILKFTRKFLKVPQVLIIWNHMIKLFLFSLVIKLSTIKISIHFFLKCFIKGEMRKVNFECENLSHDNVSFNLQNILKEKIYRSN
jgi:hypothetical protein